MRRVFVALIGQVHCQGKGLDKLGTVDLLLRNWAKTER